MTEDVRIPSWKEASEQEKEMVRTLTKKKAIETMSLILELTITIPLQPFAYALPLSLPKTKSHPANLHDSNEYHKIHDERCGL